MVMIYPRKNPQHFIEYSHPSQNAGTSPKSNVSDESDDVSDSELPECPFGSDCYRLL